MMRGKTVLLLVAIFLLGALAGFGLGAVYGNNAYNAQLESKLADAQNRFQTVNDNYMTLVREYNKLFVLRSPASAESGGVPVSTLVTPVPQTAAPAAAATPAQEPAGNTPSQAGSGKLAADFKAVTIDGTGPLEGPPPLKVKFTDLSSGTATSWKWEFGDGETSTEQNPEHLYQKACPGDKNLCTVKLTVCGADGCVTKSKPNYLWISEKCSGC